MDTRGVFHADQMELPIVVNLTPLMGHVQTVELGARLVIMITYLKCTLRDVACAQN